MATNAPTDPLERYMTEYRGMKADNAESTFRKHRSNLQRFREQLDKPLLDVTAADVRYWINDKRADGMADTTVMGYKASLSRFYRRAKVNGWIETNPIEEVVWDDYDLSKKSQKQKESPESDRIQPLTKSEVNALCENVPAPRVRNELLIRLMAQTGMRAHEAAMLRVDDVDRDSREITVRSNKTEETRTVAYQPSVAVLFSEWLDGVQRDAFAKHPDSEYLFVKRSSDDHVDENWINQMVVETAKEAGIQDVLYTDYAGSDRYKVTSHQLRHTFGVHAIDPDVGGGSMNLRYLQEVMGHSDLETTEKYLKYVEDEALTDMKRHGPTY